MIVMEEESDADEMVHYNGDDNGITMITTMIMVVDDNDGRWHQKMIKWSILLWSYRIQPSLAHL